VLGKAAGVYLRPRQVETADKQTPDSVGVLQREQIGGIADGTEHGVRAGTEGYTGDHAIAWVHLHFMSA